MSYSPLSCQNVRSEDASGNYVMPQFQGTLPRLQANEKWTRSVREQRTAKNWAAIQAFSAKHADESALREARSKKEATIH